MRRKKRRIGMLLLLGLVIWSCNRDPRGELVDITPSIMPHEGTSHKKTWLAFYGNDATKQDLILMATTIAQYEPVSILVNKTKKKELLTLLGDLHTHHYTIEVVETDLHSPYIRDIGPTFVWNDDNQKAGIHFNPPREEISQDNNVSDFITIKAKAKVVHSNLILKGNCFDVDGLGTAVMTESCIVNDALNPYWEKDEIETELKTLLGLQKIIWLKGSKETKRHHPYARFVKDGMILVHRNNDKTSDNYVISRENIEILQKTNDASEKKLEVIIVDAVQSSTSNYLEYYLCNNALIMQNFGEDETDYKAKKVLQQAFPDRTIEDVAVDTLTSDEGDIHLITLQEPEL